jgi:radical SAM protein with 4Fe4S-binding SPASM domain
MWTKVKHMPDYQFPKRIEIELASACNLKCTYCPRHFVDDLKGFIDVSLYKRLIDEIAHYPETIIVLHRRGESLLHPQFIEMMNYIRGKFKTVQLATNATLLNKAKAQAIIDAATFLSFSIDTPRRFEKTRIPAKYEKVEANILEFLKMNKTQGNPVNTQVSMVRTAETLEAETAMFQKIWEHKVDRVRIYDQHSENGVFGSIRQRRSRRKPCVMPFYEMLIYCDGKIGRCNHDWDGEPIGDIAQTDISQIWNNSVYSNLRRQQKTLMITDPVCASCDSWYPQEGEQGTGKVIEK